MFVFSANQLSIQQVTTASTFAMSTVRALLSMLQERGQRPPSATRHLLLELASCCRCEDAKAAILDDGLEPLMALAADDQALPRGETLEVLLELLVLLVLDNPKAKNNAARGGALELVDLLSRTTESQQPERQTIVLKQVLEMMTRADEDASVLVRATDTLGRFVDGSLERIQVAAKERAIPVLIELLTLVRKGGYPDEVIGNADAVVWCK
jgi:hypothetical protein